MLLAGGTGTKHFQEVIVNLERRVPRQGRYQVIQRAERERHRHAAGRADDVVTMTGQVADVGRVTVWLDDAAEDIDRGEDFERAVNRCPPDTAADRAHIGHQLLCREWLGVAEKGVDHGRAGTR